MPAATTTPRTVPAATTTPRTIPAAAAPPPERRASPTSAGAATPRLDTLTTQPTPVLPSHEVTSRPDGLTTDPTPAFSIEDLGLPSDTMPSMPALRSTEPVVRFRAQTNTPAEATPTPALEPPAKQGDHPARLITPATALFAEPDPDAEAPATRATKRDLRPSPSSTTAQPEAASHRRGMLRRVLLVLVVFVLVGTLSAVAALYLTQADDTPAPEVKEPPKPPPQKANTTIRIKFVIVPEDSTITIEGKPMHTGSPWEVDIDPVVHQIEISHEGYKGQLTSVDPSAGESQVLRVVLDRLNPTAVNDAAVPPDLADAAPPMSPQKANPANVPQSAVSKISGRLPSASKLGPDLPASISAKLCIDETGQVTSSEVLTTLQPRAAMDIADAQRAWRYAPYKVNGTARAACFIGTFRLR